MRAITLISNFTNNVHDLGGIPVCRDSNNKLFIPIGGSYTPVSEWDPGITGLPFYLSDTLGRQAYGHGARWKRGNEPRWKETAYSFEPSVKSGKFKIASWDQLPESADDDQAPALLLLNSDIPLERGVAGQLTVEYCGHRTGFSCLATNSLSTRQILLRTPEDSYLRVLVGGVLRMVLHYDGKRVNVDREIA